MQKLNFPDFPFRFKNNENNISIFDEIRKKYIVLQPEEWVRQHCIKFLINHKNYPKSLINVEKELVLNNTKKRYDIVVYRPNGEIDVIVECKSFNSSINQTTFDQIARYNLVLRANYLMVTNGLDHYFCQMNFTEKRYVFLKTLPSYKNEHCNNLLNP